MTHWTGSEDIRQSNGNTGGEISCWACPSEGSEDIQKLHSAGDLGHQ